MVTKITVYYRGHKGIQYEQVITIHENVDYAHFKALFDTLLERHEDFNIERLKEEST